MLAVRATPAIAFKSLHKDKKGVSADIPPNRVYCSWKIEKDTSPIPEQLKEFMPIRLLESIRDDVLAADTEHDFQIVIRKYVNAHGWPRDAFEGHEVDTVGVFDLIMALFTGVKAKNQRRINIQLALIMPYFSDTESPYDGDSTTRIKPNPFAASH